MLEGIVRKSTAKSETNALRRDGYLIANIYGKGLENVNAAFKSNDFTRTVRNKEAIAFPVTVDGKETNVVVQSYETHPVSGNLLHVDLMVAQPGIVAQYMVPVNPVGTPVGLKNKGMLFVSKTRLAVKSAIENLPNEITIDVTNLDLGDSVLIRDLDAIENVRFNNTDRVAVLSIIKAK
jgi:large subunit ribosomal protein L25